MPRLAVTAFGADRPGIVATVTGVLVERGGNLEDSAMTILGGHFAMMLIVEVTDAVSPAELEAELAARVAPLGLAVDVRRVTGSASDDAMEGSSWSVSVHGADHPGIVHRVTELLARHGANVVDLSTRIVGDADPPAYVLRLSVVLPATADPPALAADLQAAARELDVEVHLRADEPDIL